MIRLNEAQYRVVKKMAKAECANNDCGNCLLLDDGSLVFVCRALVIRCYAVITRDLVLPANREFCAEVMKDRSIELKRCALCKSTFAAGSNRAKYCPACAKIVHRRQKAESERNRRLRSKTTG